MNMDKLPQNEILLRFININIGIVVDIVEQNAGSTAV